MTWDQRRDGEIDEFIKWVADRDSEIQAQLDQLSDEVKTLGDEVEQMRRRLRQLEIEVTRACPGVERQQVAAWVDAVQREYGEDQ